MRRKTRPRKDETDSIAERLRSERPEASPLELDRVKTSAMSRARRLNGRRGTRRQLAIAGLTVGLMAAGTGGVIAGGATSTNPINAATAQYGQGHGEGGVLGNQNHKPPKSHRYITIHLTVPHGQTLTKVTVELNGKVLFVLRNRRVSPTILLGYLPCRRGTTTITITAVESNGAIITESRQFHLCESTILNPYSEKKAKKKS
jgi:hypothetical protein